jgi:hypothetical protein
MFPFDILVCLLQYVSLRELSILQSLYEDLQRVRVITASGRFALAVYLGGDGAVGLTSWRKFVAAIDRPVLRISSERRMP